MIDTHCHLTDPRLFAQLDGVLGRCAAAGVERVVTIGTGIEDDLEAIEVCRRHDNVRCAVGIHPNYSGNAEISDVAKLRAMHADPSVVALGEMGLDYHYDRADRSHQRAIFEAQLRLAQDVGKPVVIHCREAVDDTLAAMKQCPGVPAVFHCFTGTRDEARRILDAGYLLGFTGVITFKRNEELLEVVNFTPMDRILVETDAPFLTPMPFRGRPNASYLVPHTVRAMAQVCGADLETLCEAIDANTERAFGGPW